MSHSTSAGIRVVVVGAGMAGLTAALRLAERGYNVTVYEEKPFIGGQFGAHTHDGGATYHEHCYHFFLNWYFNFWKIAADIKCPRATCFEPRTTIKCLRKGQHLRDITSLTNVASPTYLWDNILSGTASIPDMFLYMYSIIDLLAAPLDQQNFRTLDSVNGFLNSRPYITDAALQLHQYNLSKAFASPSYLSSAATYKNFAKYSVRYPDPLLWVLKGNSQEHFFTYFEQRLRDLGCSIQKAHRLKSVKLTDQSVELQFVNALWDGLYTEQGFHVPPPAEPKKSSPGHKSLPPVLADYVILALPPKALAEVVDASEAIRNQRPQPLEDVRKLRSQSIVSIDLYFNKRLPDIPKEHVVLLDSRYELNFIDNSQLWTHQGENTFLNITASDYPILADLTDERHAWHDILAELEQYIPFQEDRDLDKEKSHIQTNLGSELFINEVGSWQWRPAAHTNMPRIFIAGDFCKSFIDVVTIEGAVVSGLQAARALQAHVQTAQARGGYPSALFRPIDIIEPESYPEFSMLALSLLWAPWAYTAKWWSWAAASRSSPQSFPDLAITGLELLWTPYAQAAQWWEAACEVYKNVFSSFRIR